jgi:hypothetical protein
MYDYRQQRLDGGADRSAAKEGRVLPHFQQIVSGASMPAVPYCGCILISQLVSHWSLVIGRWLLVVGRWSTVRVPGLWEVSLQKDKILGLMFAGTS